MQTVNYDYIYIEVTFFCTLHKELSKVAEGKPAAFLDLDSTNLGRKKNKIQKTKEKRNGKGNVME